MGIYFPNCVYPNPPCQLPCVRKPECPEKTHDFRQSVDKLFHMSGALGLSNIEKVLAENLTRNLRGERRGSDHCATEAPIKLTAGFFHDLEMWREFISHWNDANFFLSSRWHDSDTIDLHTDASGTLGFGSIFGRKWFQGKWRTHQLLGQPGMSIA